MDNLMSFVVFLHFYMLFHPYSYGLKPSFVHGFGELRCLAAVATDLRDLRGLLH